MQKLSFILIVAGILLSGCVTRKNCNRKYPPQIVRHDSIIRDTIERVRDTTIYIPPDRAYLKAWVECDENGKLLMKKIENYEAGERVKPKIIVRDNYVEIECEVDSASIAHHWIETHTKAVDSNKEVTTVEINVLTGFQWFQIWGFRILGGLLFLYIAIRVVIKTFFK